MKQIKGQMSFLRKDGLDLLSKQQKKILSKYSSILSYKTQRVDGPHNSIVVMRVSYRENILAELHIYKDGTLTLHPWTDIHYQRYTSLGRAFAALVKVNNIRE